MMRTHLDLTSGIGGFALAAAWAGYTTIGFCEIDAYCQRVLARHWPEVPIHDDITALRSDVVRGWLAGRGLGLLTAGYPCQPFSHAGKRLGDQDDRHLWPYVAALVAELRPARCLFENVAGHVSLGLDAVLADLEALGYACRAIVVPACAVDAPHRRDRVWLLAGDMVDAERGGGASGFYLDSANGRSAPRLFADGESERTNGLAVVADADIAGWQEQRGTFAAAAQHATVERSGQAVADAEGKRRRLYTTERQRRENISGGSVNFGGNQGTRINDCPSESQAEQRVGEPDDGLSGWLAGRGLTDPRWQGDPRNAFGPDWEDGVPRVVAEERHRVNRLKALGNAIVPQVAYEILRAWDAA